MKKVLLILMVICATCAYGQRLSVLGIEMGTGIDKAEKILKERYGEFNVYRTGNTELKVYDALVGGSEFDAISFTFQCARYGNVTYTFLSNINMQKSFIDLSNAESMFKIWEEKLRKKYTFESGTFTKAGGYMEIYFLEGVYFQITYTESKGGEYYWYVIINYHEDIIDESNDY